MDNTTAEHDAWLVKIMDAVRSLRMDGQRKAAASGSQVRQLEEDAPQAAELR
jgi:hypothetical protein